ncbi:MAG: hypothetical protein HN389_01450 [Clostridia bacterium]|nr:hypothetical protein [Clostridia bacterium]
MRKKKSLFAILVLLLLLTFPTIAFANPAIPEKYTHELLLDDCSNIETLTIYGYEENDNKELMYEYSSMERFNSFGDYWIKRTENRVERIFGFTNEANHFKSFQIMINFSDGEVQHSRVIDLIDNSNYHYNVERNLLKRSLVKYDFLKYFYSGYQLIPLIFACCVALLIEFLAALLFKIKPYRYVLFANLVTNPVMNIILLIAMWQFRVSYFWLVLILELIVFGAEYMFYRKKYMGINKWRLLIFTFAANAISWGIYAAITKSFI